MQTIKKIIKNVPVLVIIGVILYSYFDATYTGNRGDIFGAFNDPRQAVLFLVFPFLVVFDFVRIYNANKKPKMVTNLPNDLSTENKKFSQFTIFVFWLPAFFLYSQASSLHYLSRLAESSLGGTMALLNLVEPFIFLALFLIFGKKAESRNLQLKNICILTIIWVLCLVIF